MYLRIHFGPSERARMRVCERASRRKKWHSTPDQFILQIVLLLSSNEAMAGELKHGACLLTVACLVTGACLLK